MEAKLAAEAKLAEAQQAAEAKLAAAKLAAEARLADAKVAESKKAEARSPKKAPDPTETYVRPQSSDLFSPSPIAPAVPYLKAVSGGLGDDTFRLEQRDHEYMFGRTARCEFRVKTNEVSREHASFTRRADGVYVNDLGSVNGVLVNNTRVREFRLYDGDLIQLGHIKLRLFDPTEPSPRESDVSTAVRCRASRPLAASRRAARLVRVGGHARTARRATVAPARVPPVRGDAAARPGPTAPLVAGPLAAEVTGYGRRPSVRVRIPESWSRRAGFATRS